MGCSCAQGGIGACFHVLYMEMFGKDTFPDGCEGLGEGAH